MPESSALGKVIRILREQVGLSQDEVAAHLNTSASLIQEWEEGRRELPKGPEFYQSLGALLGFSVSDLKHLLWAYYTQEILDRGILFDPETRAIIVPVNLSLNEETQDPQHSFTESSDRVMIPLLNPFLLADLALTLVQSEAKPTRIHYSHAMPEHAPELVDEGKWQPSNETSNQPEVAQPRRRYGVVYERQLAGEKEGEKQLERLITVQDATDILNVPQSTVWHWVTTGRLKERGRVWLAKPGGRGTPLVSEAEVESLKNTRPPMGRPRKRGKSS